MSGSANVHTSDAIEAVKAALIFFKDQVEQALSTNDIEMRRVLDWLEHDRPRYWKTRVRTANDAVTAAKAALTRCLMYPINDERPSCYEERAELKKAEAERSYCEEKAERLRHWIREVRHELFEYEGRISQLVELVESDVPAAIGVLNKFVVRLEEYQAIRSRSSGTPIAAPSPPDLPTEGGGDGS
ncbi:MAG TPA: hypothetical protein VGM76_00715 [Lacipirellulaceae bacterium]|jgi:hypothetical protein